MIPALSLVENLAITPLLPLIGAVLIGLIGNRNVNLRDGVSVAASILVAIQMVSVALACAETSEAVEIELWTLIPGISLAFHAEPLGLVFALVASLLWIPTSLYAIGYMRGNNEPNQTRFYICFSVSIGAALAIAFSANLVTLFIAYEALTLATYPLVSHKQNQDAKSGARVYLGILLTTSIGFLLPAIIWTWALSGRMDFVAGGILSGTAGPGILGLLYALFLFGVGKAALMPFHRWLPRAMVAPTPVSALLHAVAVVKAGVFSVLKITIYVFGIDLLSLGISTPLLWVACFTLLMSSIIALHQDNLKARLAYSTVSQLSYIVVGASLATTMSIAGGAMHIIMHAAGKITLFFCAGAIYTAAHKTKVSELHGLGKQMPWTFAAFILASLSIIGVPPLGGVWSKWFLMLGAADAGQIAVLIILLLSTLLNIAYLIPIGINAFRSEPSAPATHGEAPMMMVVPLCMTAAACIALFFLGDPIYQWLMRIPL